MKVPEDHRTRVAAKPRSEAQERLFSVLIVVSEKPTKEISIEGVYTHAETFWGTFYKYFNETSGLLKGLKRPKIDVKKLFSVTGQFLSKSAAIFAIFDVFSPELQYI